jgi:hypothetical protein
MRCRDRAAREIDDQRHEMETRIMSQTQETKNRLSKVLTVAVCGILAGATMGCTKSDTTPKTDNGSTKSAADQHACKGQNACKGQGGCGSSDNGCKGKNSCKGKGGCDSKHK